jgi:uncharacterized protein DUF5687
MLLTLLSHQWKSFWRSRSAGKGLVVQLFLGFLILYLLAVAVGVGFYLQTFIQQVFPGKDVILVFCGFILYYFFIDILMRFLLQDLPTLTIQPYLTQNIKRSQLIRFLNIRSLFNFFNLLPLLLFVPFSVVVIGVKYGAAASAGFWVSIFFLTVFNHFFILYIKRKTIVNSWWLAGFFVVITSFGLCDYFNIFSVTHISSIIFIKLIHHFWLCIFAIALAVISFINNYNFLLKNLYLEDISGKSKRRESTEYTFLDRFGNIGELVSLDVKLLLRNKRPRTVLMLSVAFLFYGFIFYKPELIAKGNWGFLLIGGVFVTGLFIINYGQFLFAWQSSHFDGLMSSNLHVRTYIKSKFVLLTAVSTIVFFISSLYGLLAWKLILIQTAAYFYNVGINTVIVGYFATRSYKAIDISRGATFNYQGLGASQWIYSLFVFLVPMAIYLPFGLLISKWAGILALGIAGLISLLLQDWWIGILTKEFFKRKYLILQGFREK